MSVHARKKMMILLLLAFCLQTYFVYSDGAGRVTAPLSEKAQEGWKLWHGNNCQSCHQMYGFGGFLGPDLTNFASRMTDARLTSILTDGAGQMPAFHLSEPEQAALKQYFVEFDRTGVGQVKANKSQAARAILEKLSTTITRQTVPLSEAEERGAKIVYEQNCIDCHLPNLRSAYRAPDMTSISERLTGDDISRTLREGIAGKGMPKFDLSDDDIRAVIDYFAWMQSHAAVLREGFVKAQPESENPFLNLPWFEYSR